MNISVELLLQLENMHAGMRSVCKNSQPLRVTAETATYYQSTHSLCVCSVLIQPVIICISTVCSLTDVSSSHLWVTHPLIMLTFYWLPQRLVSSFWLITCIFVSRLDIVTLSYMLRGVLILLRLPLQLLGCNCIKYVKWTSSCKQNRLGSTSPSASLIYEFNLVENSFQLMTTKQTNTSSYLNLFQR